MTVARWQSGVGRWPREPPPTPCSHTNGRPSDDGTPSIGAAASVDTHEPDVPISVPLAENPLRLLLLLSRRHPLV